MLSDSEKNYSRPELFVNLRHVGYTESQVEKFSLNAEYGILRRKSKYKFSTAWEPCDSKFLY